MCTLTYIYIYIHACDYTITYDYVMTAGGQGTCLLSERAKGGTHHDHSHGNAPDSAQESILWSNAAE